MNSRVLAASAQAPQRSNGNDFLPHNAPRPEKGGLAREGRHLKEDGDLLISVGSFVFEGCTHFCMLDIFFTFLSL